MKKVSIVVCGCGGVGKEFLKLVNERQNDVKKTYGLELVVCAVVDINGAAISENGLSVDSLLSFLQKGSQVQDFPTYGVKNVSGIEVINNQSADVLVETTPTNLVDGGAAKGHIFAAIDKKMEVVSANKGPFVLFYEEIFNKAKISGIGLHISAATAAALPTIDVGLRSIAGTRVNSIEGILNGTSNYVLTKMSQEGTAYEDAIKEAQELGIAETDPSYDVEGKDTGNKILLITNLVFQKTLGLNDVPIEGITNVTLEDIQQADQRGKVIKLIGSAETSGNAIKLEVKPKLLDKDHPLASVNGSEKAITYDTDTMGKITVMGGKSSPVGAAAALFKDLINAFR